jgi:serine/threonine-protein kinase
MFPIILGVAVAFVIVMLVSGIIVFDAILTMDNANAPETIHVPDLVGKTLNDENKDELLDPALFNVNIVYVHDESPIGTVISQQPVGNSKKKIQKGLNFCPITLTVSRGAELVSVPDFSTMEYRQALILAESDDFKFKVKFVDVTSEIFGVGIVVGSKPAYKTEVPYGSTITIYKSIGPEYTMIKAENYVGLTPSQAYTRINGDFIISTNVKSEYSDEIPEGHIISQSLTPNMSYIKYTTIEFVVSLGPEPSDTTDEGTP